MRMEDGAHLRLNDDGTRAPFICNEDLEAAAMMEPLGEDEEELTQEEFWELAQGMREAREETGDPPDRVAPNSPDG